MILVDTSVWVEVLRDKKGRVVRAFRERIGTEAYVFSRFTQLALLQGAKDDQEWGRIDDYLSTQYYETFAQPARERFCEQDGLTLICICHSKTGLFSSLR